jgi:hypothetical protein
MDEILKSPNFGTEMCGCGLRVIVPHDGPVPDNTQFIAEHLLVCLPIVL